MCAVQGLFWDKPPQGLALMAFVTWAFQVPEEVASAWHGQAL